MRNSQVAEWILSLVTSSDRAASMVGDLMEDAASHGAVWFWIGVLRTAFSLLWRLFSNDPAQMIGLAARGFLLQLVMFVASIALSTIAIVLWWFFTGWPVETGPLPLPATEWTLGSVFFWVLIPFQIGRWLARRSPGRELAPVVAFTIFNFVLFNGVGMFWPGIESSLFEFITGLFFALAWVILCQIPVLAGAVSVRRKRLSQ
jgi:hypothetical protein